MLELQNICYEIVENNKKKKILDNVSLSIADGELVVITGPNGSGKSTLSKIIMGLIKPTSGKILYKGKDITNISICERAKMGISFAFQQPVQFKGLTVKDLIDIASCKKNTVIEACEFLSKVGLCAREYIDRPLDSKLSGGELKRIELALVLAKNGELNICDEPEAGIDLWSFDALVRLFGERTKTYLVISHQKRLIEIADKIILLKNGVIDSQGDFKNLQDKLTNQVCDRLGGEA